MTRLRPTSYKNERPSGTRERLHHLLCRQEGFVSGEELSRRLNISRAAVWKQIHQMIECGYAIEHGRNGYRLLVTPDGLGTAIRSRRRWGSGVVGRRVRYHDCLSSTMDEVFRAADEEDAPEGLVVVAGRQTKGRGQRGRSWVSLKDSGLYFSLLLRPHQSPRCAVPLTLLGAVAVAETVKGLSGVRVDLKWPNDIVWHDRKLAGILVEMRSTTDEVDVLVMGVGINVHHAPAQVGACCLRELVSRPVDRTEVLQDVLRRLGRGYRVFQREGPAPLIDQWRRLSACRGRRVSVRGSSSGSWRPGRVDGLDEDGALIVRCDDTAETIKVYSSAQLKWMS